MIIPFTALFSLSVALRGTNSIFNIAYVLSGVSNMIDFNSKKSIRNNTIKLDLFYIWWGTAM